MNDFNCPACNVPMDSDDNFCRQCGHATSASHLPAVRTPRAAVLWQPRVSPVVKGAAVMAAGTVGQFIFRRMVSNILEGGARQKPMRIKRRGRDNDGLEDEAQIITETVMMRRVRIRRQA